MPRHLAGNTSGIVSLGLTSCVSSSFEVLSHLESSKNGGTLCARPCPSRKSMRVSSGAMHPPGGRVHVTSLGRGVLCLNAYMVNLTGPTSKFSIFSKPTIQLTANKRSCQSCQYVVDEGPAQLWASGSGYFWKALQEGLAEGA